MLHSSREPVSMVDPSSQRPQGVILDRRIVRAHNQLNKSIESLDVSIQTAIEKSQAQFIQAYRVHLHKMRAELQEIKKKYEEQQKQLSANEKVMQLNAEVKLLKKDIVKLYARLQQQKIELSVLKSRCEESGAQCDRLQRENKQLKRQLIIKQLQTQAPSATSARDQKKSGNEPSEHAINSITVASPKVSETGAGKRRLPDRYFSPKSRASSIYDRSSLDGMTANMKEEKVNSLTKLQQWLADCIATVRQEISPHQGGNQDRLKVQTLAQLRAADKMKVLQLLLTNDQLLSYLYFRIFPASNQKLAQSLLVHPCRSTSSQAKLTEWINETEQEVQLPRLSPKPRPQKGIYPTGTHARQNVIVSNGRLSLQLSKSGRQ